MLHFLDLGADSLYVFPWSCLKPIAHEMLHLLIIFPTKSVVFKIKKAFDNLLKIHMLCAGQ